MNTKELLEELTTQLSELTPLLVEAGDAYGKASYACSLRRSQLYLGDGCSIYKNQEMRDAYVISVLLEEGLSEIEFQTRSKWKRLQTERELLTEISTNLRAIIYNK